MNLKLLAVLAAFGCSLALGQDPSATPSKPPSYEQKLAAFAEQARQRPLAPGCNLFIGSSSIERWGKLYGFESSEPIVWHGVGGTRVPFLLANLDRLLLSFVPKRIFIYSGDNDIGDGKGGERSADEVIANYQELLARIRAKLPQTKIYILAIKPSLKRIDAAAIQARANAGLQKLATENSGVTYVDVGTPLLGEDGKPKADFFAPDGLHLNEKGYAVWTGIVKKCMAD